MDELREIGSRLEPLWDGWLIERLAGVRQRLHAPVLRETVLRFDQPWEGPISWVPNVRHDGGRFRMWYRAGGDGDQRLAYAESDDAVTWQRPALGLVEHGGSRANNILIDGSAAHSISVFIDGNPAAAADARYKAIGIGAKIDGRDTLRGFASPDGIHFRLVADPLLVAPAGERPWFDSQNLVFWNGLTGEYELYCRGWIDGIRAIRRSVSRDFVTWSALQFIDLGDAPREHLYENSATPYPRAPHIRLMFPKRFFPERQLDPTWYNGLSDAIFMTSRDGHHWERRHREAFLRPGPDPDNWTERNMYVGPGIVATGPAELSMFVVEHYRHPTAHVRRATIRTDGFVSVAGDYDGGVLHSRPLRFAGARLRLNIATSAGGAARVALCGLDDQPIAGHSFDDCDEIYGDQIDRIVTWRGGADIAALAGQPIRMQVRLHNADLYALQFGPPT